MAEQVSASGGIVEHVARIVVNYVRHHQIEPGQLVRLIGEVHRALSSLGQSAPSVPEPRHPAVCRSGNRCTPSMWCASSAVSLQNIAPASAGAARA
jgi:predicted transcriptional regulator